MLFKGKNILIIGGTGTLGVRLIQKLLEERPRVIRIFSRDEYKQHLLQNEFRHLDNIRYLIGDIRDSDRVRRAMENIDYVFHLAAMKHVSSCEYNPFEAVQTNVIGTQHIIQGALEMNVQKVIFTSTDKAISPTSTYGATKLTAERLISAAENQKGSKRTIFASVRFGNVLGSRGSVIPLFKKQILQQQAVTVTNKEMTRYMMTPSQAIQLILKAAELAQGGEVFVLKMPTIKLSDLVDVLITEMKAKHKLEHCIQVEEMGLRPGEKMYEELMTPEEKNQAIETDLMYIIPSLHSEHSKGIYEFTTMAAADREYRSHLSNHISREKLTEWLYQELLL